jgi:hypothetical protein
MAALFSAVVRAPLTGVVLILEMTGSHELLFALIVTAMTAYFVADFLGTKPIYERCWTGICAGAIRRGTTTRTIRCSFPWRSNPFPRWRDAALRIWGFRRGVC